MPTNTKWGRAGWGRSPSVLRRQMPPSFMHRHDLAIASGTYGESRVVSSNVDFDLSSQSEIEGWVESLLSVAEES